jgi:hypothetical protein
MRTGLLVNFSAICRQDLPGAGGRGRPPGACFGPLPRGRVRTPGPSCSNASAAGGGAGLFPGSAAGGSRALRRAVPGLRGGRFPAAASGTGSRPGRVRAGRRSAWRRRAGALRRGLGGAGPAALSTIALTVRIASSAPKDSDSRSRGSTGSHWRSMEEPQRRGVPLSDSPPSVSSVRRHSRGWDEIRAWQLRPGGTTLATSAFLAHSLRPALSRPQAKPRRTGLHWI